MPGLTRMLLVLLCCGCGTSRNTELLESRLREHEDRLHQLSQQLERSENELALSQKEAADLRTQLAGTGQPVLQPEQANVLYRLSGLKIDQLQSAILPASESDQRLLNVVVTPVDQYNEALKIPGNLELKLLDESTELARFDIPAAELAENWSTGWVTSGYVIQLPLDASLLPTSPVNVVVTLRSLDGREFSHQARLETGVSAGVIEQVSFEDKVPDPPGMETKVPTPREPVSAPPPHDSLTVRPQNDRIETSDRRTIDEFPIYR
ncbi:hypothetical protein [Rubinisphaera margarita]|uniref:hypothetical protein n=1 Tax=Rubinisphaera margarita TaxID=2909586 RepID=UPI001EE7A302|nr:hypothetical protein [Rubinisphaera margarita]MCG6156852.1 hypothetical protein [Rubinisphaera margarita]